MDKNEIPAVGTKIQITLKDIFGKPYAMTGKIATEPYHHGYHCRSGAWCLYPSDGDIPCYKIEFIPQRKRRAIILAVKDISSIYRLT